MFLEERKESVFFLAVNKIFCKLTFTQALMPFTFHATMLNTFPTLCFLVEEETDETTFLTFPEIIAMNLNFTD